MEPIVRMNVTRARGATTEVTNDVVVVEEPLEIRVGERPVSVTMRTPGDDFDLAAGFLFPEWIPGRSESIRHGGSPNVGRVDVREPVDLQRLQRHFYSTSSCGVCGKTSIDALRVNASRVTRVEVPPDVIHAIPQR